MSNPIGRTGRGAARIGVALGAALLVFAMATAALADNVLNDVTVGGNDTFTLGGSTTVKYRIQATSGDGQTGCNASDGTDATVTINAPTAVTATPSSLVFDTCGTDKAVVFTATAAGSYAISVSVSDAGAGTYNPTPGGFTLHVLEPTAPSDTTPPTITINTPANGAEYVLGATVLADYSCADESGGSGLASCLGPVAGGAAIDTGSVGSKSFTVNAADNAGNTNTLTHTYHVVYDFAGFFRPVDNLPTLNSVKAGSAVPLKFSLSGNQGLSIFAANSPSSQKVNCDAGAPIDAVEETLTAGNSSLNYDASIDQYNYVWKTDKAWAGTCRTLTLKLADGKSYMANFKLLK